MAGTLYPEVTGLICRVPSQTLSPTRLGLLSQGHLCQILVRTRALAPWKIFTGTEHYRNPPEGGHVTLSPGSHHDGSPPDYTLIRGDGRGPVSPMRLSHGQGRPWCRNINLLPFPERRLSAQLGPTNPRLTIIVEETWPFRRTRFSRVYAVTHTRILIPTRSTGP